MKLIRVAFVGLPNVGKSTLFNAITGFNQHVGNWPGKTVDIAWGDVEYKGFRFRVVDLPGTYSIHGETEEEKIVEEYLSTNPDIVGVVADASKLKQSLYPLAQVMERGHRVFLVVNMLDEAESLGYKIDIKKLSKILGIPVVGVVATSGNVKPVLDAMISALSSKPRRLRFRAKGKKKIEEIYRFIDKIAYECVKGGRKRDRVLDKNLFKWYVDLSLFLLTFVALFIPTFFFGKYAGDLVSSVISLLGENFITEILDAIFSFFPLVFTFFFMFALLEDSGLLARIAASIDRYMPIPGKAFFPFLMSFGCNVIGIPATRIIKERKYKRAVVLAIPFIPCSARIAVMFYLLSFFSFDVAIKTLVFILVSLVVVVLMTVKIFSRKKKESLIIELPPLRKPSIKNSVKISWLRTKVFILRISLWITIGYFLAYLIMNITPEKTPNMFWYLGFSVKETLSLIFGFFAKELTLGGLTSVYGTTNILQAISLVNAVKFLVFYSFYTPCLATLAAIKSECGLKTAVLSFLWSLLVASALSIIAVHLIV